MQNKAALDGDDGERDDASLSRLYWWRSSEEFDEKGHLKIDFCNISNLTPRLQLLREMERLALIAPESLNDLHHRLISYSPGDLYFPTGGFHKQHLDIPPLITILLVGFQGSGKSSLINLMYSVLGRSGLIPFAQTSRHSWNRSAMCLEEHNVLRSQRNGFCLFDSRGLDYEKMDESLNALCDWMGNGVRHQQEGWRERGDECNGHQGSGLWWSERSKYAKRRVNCVMVVVNVAEICRALKAGNLKPLQATKELFYCPVVKQSTEKPILILTHGDQLSTDERLKSRLVICEFLGISATAGAYDIPCLTEHGILADQSDAVAAYSLAEAVYRALLISDRTHTPNRNFKDWLLLCISFILCSIAALFALLADLFSQVENKIDKLLKH